MALTLTAAQLQELADQLFLLKTQAQTALPKPINTEDIKAPDGTVLEAKSLVAKLKPISEDARFKEMGIGVVDFTTNKMSPKIWLHNGDVSWHIGSAAKITILLAATQLREDVRAIKAIVDKNGFGWTPTQYDEFFALADLWKKGKNAAEAVHLKQIGGLGNAPRISSMFDFAKSPVDFFGPDPNVPDGAKIMTKVGANHHMDWPEAPELEFSERLWLAAAHSDNRAATSCVSELGVPYLKAVQRAYGLSDAANGMHLLLADGYGGVGDVRVSKLRNPTVKYRSLTHPEQNLVNPLDMFQKIPGRGPFNDQRSKAPASAAALLGYMIALVQDKLASASACTTIRKNLGGGPNGLTCYIPIGVGTIADVTLTHNKIGILGPEDGAPAPLDCEFVYMETKERTPPAKTMAYGIVLTGIRTPDAAPDKGVDVLSKELGIAVHRALL